MVAVVGRANAGKSTLVNYLLEEKVSIVSHIAQTTRNLIRGIFTEPRGQLVFLDTPGVHKTSTELGKIMNRQARKSVEGTDVVLLILDASSKPAIEDDGWMRRLLFESATIIFLINKIDKKKDFKEDYQLLWNEICAEKETERTPLWLHISAKHGTGLDTLIDTLFEHMPYSPLLFPEDVLTDFPRMLTISDTIREQFFQVLYEELPHSIGVIIEELDESEEAWTVSATVYVEKHSQKVIVLGTKGRLLRTVKRKSEAALSQLYDRDVKVKLWIKIEPKWQHNFWLMKKMGFSG